MGCDVVETVEVSHDFRLLDGGVLADFKLCSEACVVAISVVEHVDAEFRRHVQTIVGANVHAHLARRTGFPNHADSPVVITGDKEPRLHVFEALVRVLNRLWLPKRWLKIRSDTVRCKFLA